MEIEAHLVARNGVECAERLVHQEQFGIVYERAHDCGALVHSAGKLVGKAIRELAESDASEQIFRAFDIVGSLQPAYFDLQENVVQDRSPGQQQMLLEDDAELVHRTLDRLAENVDGAVRRPQQARDHVEEGALATAARSDDRDEFAASDRQGNVVNGVHLAFARLETFRDVTKRDGGHGVHAVGARRRAIASRPAMRRTSLMQAIAPPAPRVVMPTPGAAAIRVTAAIER